MPKSRFANAKDANHNEIDAEFQRLGWVTHDVHDLKNFCDLIVAKDRVAIMIEIKDGKKPPSARKLSEGEIEFRDKWIAGGGLWSLVMCVEDVHAINAEIKIKK